MNTTAVKIDDLDILTYNNEEKPLDIHDSNSSSKEQICIKMLDYLLF